jgi:putative sporulation protein YtaF
MKNVFSILLLVLSANLDTFVLVFTYGLARIRISVKSSFIIAFVTSIGTFLSIYFGSAFIPFLPTSAADLIGGCIMILLGIYFIVKHFNLKKISAKENDCTDINIQENSIQYLDKKSTFLFAILLSVNNLSIGVAAGLSSVPVLGVTISTFLVTLLCIFAGTAALKSPVSKWISKYSICLSGILLIILGIYEWLF